VLEATVRPPMSCGQAGVPLLVAGRWGRWPGHQWHDSQAHPPRRFHSRFRARSDSSVWRTRSTMTYVRSAPSRGPLSQDPEKGKASYWTPRRILETLLDEPDRDGLISWAMNWWPRPATKRKRRAA